MIHQTLVVKRRVGDAKSSMYAGRGSYFTLFSGILTAAAYACRLYWLGYLCTVQCTVAAVNILAGILKFWEFPWNILEKELHIQPRQLASWIVERKFFENFKCFTACPDSFLSTNVRQKEESNYNYQGA